MSPPNLPSLSPRKTKARRVQIGGGWLGMTTGCNLACTYCFLPPDRKGTGAPALMSKETASRSIVYLGKLWRAAKKREAARVIFFGGEPLLNFSVIEHAVHFAREWGRLESIPFKFSLCTNAMLVTAAIGDFLSRERIRVQVSLDGPEVMHDATRVRPNGTGSFEAVMHGIKQLRQSDGIRIIIRGTIPIGAPSLTRLVEFYTQEKFRFVELKFASDNASSGAGISTGDYERFSEETDEVADALALGIRKGVRFLPFAENVASLGKPDVAPFVCGAGQGAVSISTDGSVYPCHRFHDKPEYRIGSINDHFDPSVSRRFAALVADEFEVCSTCWAVRFCRGCCPAESLAHGELLGRPYEGWCRGKRLEAELSLKLAVALDQARRAGRRHRRRHHARVSGQDTRKGQCTGNRTR